MSARAFSLIVSGRKSDTGETKQGVNHHTITLGQVRSVTGTADVQSLQCNECCTQVIKDEVGENKACLFVASRVYQLIPCCLS